jgi:hypothetical protein
LYLGLDTNWYNSDVYSHMLYGGYFMKRSFWQHTLATLALIVALPAAVLAQADPVVVNELNVVVPNGEPATGYLLTEFPDTLVDGGNTAYTFTVINNGDADLEVGYISGSAEFLVSQPATPGTTVTVAAGNDYNFTVTYDPVDLGEDDLALVISTNVGNYVLNVAGEGVAEIDPLMANLTAEWAAKNGVVKPLKVKLDKKTGLFKVTGQVYVYNTGGTEVLLADAEIWYSADDVLDEDDTNLGTLAKPLKKIKVAVAKPGKPVKYKKKTAKVQVITPAAEGYIFVRTFLVSPDTQELTYLDNTVSLELP